MSLFGKIFGKKPEPSQPPTLTPPPPYPTPQGAPEMLKIWDAYGRIMEIPREAWRTKVLPDNFLKAWNNPDELANLIAGSLREGFIPDCLEPSRQLFKIDPKPKRGALYLAVILLQLKQFDEAEKILKDAMRQHGEEGVLLTNLAKAYSGKGDQSLAERTLWHALELDPNQDNGFLWYQAMFRDRGGNEAADAAMRRIAALPGSWRAQLWLAREALKARNSDAAMVLYKESLSRVSKPIPADVLMQISGDLGNAGHCPEILQLVEPHYDAANHGLEVGSNLIKAHVDLGQFDAARRILEQLYGQKRPDWNEHLRFWETEIAKARLAISKPRQTPMQVTLLTIEGPVWLKPSSPAADLFRPITCENISIAFLGSTIVMITNSQRTQQQLSDAPGRMSRALPLFLAEQVEFQTGARVRTFVPWIMGESPGFVLSGGAWKDEDAANHARNGEIKSDYIITTHLNANADPWSVELRLVRTIDSKCLATLNGSFAFGNPKPAMTQLATQLLKLLGEHAELETVASPRLYQVPADQSFGSYLVRLEQLLAVRCTGMDGVPKTFLNGEREIVDGNIQLCINDPQNVGIRILLAQTLLDMKRVRPEILPEFKDKTALLQKEKALTEPAQGVVQRMINDAFAS